MTRTYVPARPASTVLLLRDGPTGLEVYMQKRHAEMSFAASAYIFPGGSMDDRDASDDAMQLLSGVDMGQVAARMGFDAVGTGRRTCAALHVCAVREVVEECGVLLARPVGGGQLSPDDAAKVHARLVAGGDFATEMERFGLRPAVEDLTYVAHFITPSGAPRRYDTRFFVAAVPPEQEAALRGGEASDDGWYSSQSLLAGSESGALLLMPPTRILSAELSRHRNVAGLRAELGSRPVPPILFRLRSALSGPMPDHLPTAEEVAAMEEFE